METTVIELDYVPTNPNGDIEGKCNGKLDNCKNPECDYRYVSSSQVVCSQCGVDREYCSNWPQPGRERCHLHGGNRAIGLAAGGYSGKGLSKVLSTKMLDSYRAYFEDPDMLDMTEDIALLRMRRDALVQKWQEQNVSENQWNDLKTAHENLCYHIELNHANKINEMLYQLGKIIANGYSDILLWQEIAKIEEQITRTKDRESKRRKTANTVISEREFRQLFGFILSIIDNRVKDSDVKNQILLDLQRLNQF